MSFRTAVETVGRLVDLLGVAIIVVGIVVAAWLAVTRGRSGVESDPYQLFRRVLGRAILLALELLVAADIIYTVAVSPTLRNAGVLAIIVGIRTFLSFSLEVELEHRWPWQPRPTSAPGDSGDSQG